jgi:hypothetical protein
MATEHVADIDPAKNDFVMFGMKSVSGMAKEGFDCPVSTSIS